jgi:heavy metal translocating P-type ATPase
METKVEKLKVSGMACSFCAATIEKALKREKGVNKVTVLLETQEVYVRYDTKYIDSARIRNLVSSLGYYLIDGEASSKQVLSHTFFRAAISFAVTVMLWLIDMGHIFTLTKGNAEFYPWLVSMSFAFVSNFGAGFNIQKGALRAATKGILNEHVLYGVSSTAAFFIGGLGFMNRAYVPFFVVSSLLTTLHLSSGALQSVVDLQVEKALGQVMGNVLPKVIKLKDTRYVDVLVSDVSAGDLVVVNPGSRILFDGVVEDGESEVAEAVITGESVPVRKKKQDFVYAGTTNGSGRLLIKVLSRFNEGYISRILDLVNWAKQTKSSSLTLLENVMQHIWVPFVLAVTTCTFLAWELASVITGNHALTLNALANALLVASIGYPCAIGLSYPLVRLTAFVTLLKQGIIIKGEGLFEKIKNIDMVIFDKTGVLTQGELKLKEVHPGEHKKELVFLAAAVAQHSAHPVSRAITAQATDMGLVLPPAEDLKEVAGKGVVGKVNGHLVALGSKELLKDYGLYLPEPAFSHSSIHAFVSSDAGLAGVFGFSDAVRKEAKDVINWILDKGIGCIMLTGDKHYVACEVASQIGQLQFAAECSPEKKLRTVYALRNQGRRVLMIGDGINDVAAFAAADVGCAFGKSIDVARQHADVVIVGGNLEQIPRLLRLARSVVTMSLSSIIGAIFFSTLGIMLASLGHLTVMLTMVLMAFDFATVIAIGALITPLILRRQYWNLRLDSV